MVSVHIRNFLLIGYLNLKFLKYLVDYFELLFLCIPTLFMKTEIILST